jgi:hypothetical protein
MADPAPVKGPAEIIAASSDEELLVRLLENLVSLAGNGPRLKPIFDEIKARFVKSKAAPAAPAKS